MILVTGATGNVGRELVAALVRDGAAVRAVTRDPASAQLPRLVDVVGADLDEPEALGDALGGVEALFLLSGFRDMNGLLARAQAAGVQRVVLVSGGGAAATDVDNPISRFQLESEEATRRSGIAWTILRPYAFMSNALRWLPQLRAGDVVRAPFAGVAEAVIDPADIAAVAAVALRTGDHSGRVLRLSGATALSPADRVRILAEALGRPLRFEPISDDEAREDMGKRMPADYVEAFMRFYVDGTVDESQPLPTVADVLGRPPRAFGEWARAHVDAFR